MRLRAVAPITASVAALAVAGVAVFAVAATPTATVSKPTDAQKFFETAVAADPKATAAVKNLLASDAGIIDPASGFTDVTGDGRSDALIFVTTGGVASRVALYVFSTHGQTDTANTDLKVVYRNQLLHNATIKISGTTITITEPKYSEGDDIGSPARKTERDYRWDGKTFLKVATRTVNA